MKLKRIWPLQKEMGIRWITLRYCCPIATHSSAKPSTELPEVFVWLSEPAWLKRPQWQQWDFGRRWEPPPTRHSYPPEFLQDYNYQ
ncbi:hypothetical protein CEXT_706041 [Caerostris extrusa]|uniref:Uncharacterized protein n=1 Tax=Caerostris extrusa TaxID=172846 RepID=A0AAV4XFI9_CAEEX|nr:hypothetical protein CEXT_706041 [Caerostris extrusa]